MLTLLNCFLPSPDTTSIGCISRWIRCLQELAKKSLEMRQFTVILPGADISERVVTLAKMTGWRIGTAISTIAMASVEHGMAQADVNLLVQEQLPIVTSQATMEANAILQTMSFFGND